MMYIHPKAHDYQVKALQFALAHNASYLALDMGLGKTLISLMWIKNIKAKGVLIVAPIKPMYNTWPDEIEKWTPDLTHTIIHGTEKARNLRKKADTYITNFESIVWLYDELKTMFSQKIPLPFNAVVIDEGSMIKSSKTKRFKTLRKLYDLFPAGRIILSATPAPNSMLNLWSQYFFLDRGERLFKTYGQYQLTYFNKRKTDMWSWDIKPEAEPLIHKAVSDITYRLDADDHIKQPARIDNFIKLSLPEKIQNQYNRLEEEFFLQLNAATSMEVFNKAALSMKLRQFVQGAVYTDTLGTFERIHYEKRDALKGLMETTTQPILCAIQFKFELVLLREIFPDVPAIVGGVSNAQANEYIRAWNRKELPLLLCHPASIGHGMNMQAGSNVILWYGMPWSGELYEQLIGRLKRQGQEEDHVVVHHLLMKNTIDIAIAASLKAKAKGQRGLLDYLKMYHKGEVTV